MRDALRLAATVAAALLLAACGVRSAPGSGKAAPGPSGSPAQGTGSSAPAPAPVAPSGNPPGQATAPAAPVGQAPAGTAPPGPTRPAGPSEETIHWYVPSIGAPLRSDDPRAKGKKVVMLTFDDGPKPETTPLILDVLKRENVKALFFVTGYGAKNEDLLRRIHEEGHRIGTHTVNHTLLTRLQGRDAIRAEIEPVNQVVERVTGQRVRYFRPPNGMYNADVLAVVKELGLELINWSHGSQDWVLANTRKDPAEVVRYVLAEKPPAPGATVLHPGAVILMHDTLPWTAQALPDIIAGLRERGYAFVLLDP
ncbi:polysaccharide deacetylase family protein [Caldinitratiruptor microaerophilus]|uniref:NodB homology domain-containing protein n=1 Tax=Caldinitratiruptor microaerophilus TaxID=671077 RepID=A0AA35CPX4_9FIRM|nr:polysaccharide deacetylase family protein [Caldinitratiruptor microaerophilus]BDG61675.1 hypothetical protein caldi_27650 [Caldinitratiruptor microaerophilus]